MKLKITQPFNNDDTGQRYLAGDIIEVSDERYKKMKERAEEQELDLSEYVEEIKEVKSKAAGDTPAK